MKVIRYHPLLVALHWVLALLIAAMLGVGFFGIRTLGDDNPEKVVLLAAHMAGGVVIFALMVIRFIVRVKTSKPARATTGHPVLDRVAPISHYGFYLLILLMVGTGFATAILSGLNLIVFGGTGAPLPRNLWAYPSFVAHIYGASILVALITLHVCAACYHQFVVKDGLLGRLVFGRRGA